MFVALCVLLCGTLWQVQCDLNTQFLMTWLPLFALDQPTALETKVRDLPFLLCFALGGGTEDCRKGVQFAGPREGCRDGRRTVQLCCAIFSAQEWADTESGVQRSLAAKILALHARTPTARRLKPLCLFNASRSKDCNVAKLKALITEIFKAHL